MKSDHPPTGQDIKVMAVRHKYQIDLIIASAMIDRRGAILGAAQRVRGRVKVNLAPQFEDSAQIRPPCASTIPLAI